MPIFTNKTAPIVRVYLDADTELDFRPNITTLDQVRLAVAKDTGRMANEMVVKNINTGKYCTNGSEIMPTADYKIVNISKKEHNEEFWFEGLYIHAMNLDYEGLERCLRLYLKETCPPNYAREKLISRCVKNNLCSALDMILNIIKKIEEEEKKIELEEEKRLIAKSGKINRIAALPLEKPKVDLHAAKNRLINWSFANEDGYTPAHIAAEDGHYKCLQMLIDNGADVECASSYGAQYSPLQVAVRSNLLSNKEHVTSQMAVINLLLTSGVNLEVEDSYGNTALLVATSEGSKDSIKALLNAGANIDHKNKNEETALDLARRVRKEPLKKSLEARLEKKQNVSLFKRIFSKNNSIKDVRESNNTSDSELSKVSSDTTSSGEEYDFAVNKKKDLLLCEKPSYTMSKTQYAKWQ
jgi:hypothetical protein